MTNAHRSLAALITLLVTSGAFADVIPPPYVETCTLERQHKGGWSCVECASTWETRDKCRKELAQAGFVYRCQTRGAVRWVEIWCQPPPASPQKTSMRCGSAGPKVPGEGQQQLQRQLLELSVVRGCPPGGSTPAYNHPPRIRR